MILPDSWPFFVTTRKDPAGRVGGWGGGGQRPASLSQSATHWLGARASDYANHLAPFSASIRRPCCMRGPFSALLLAADERKVANTQLADLVLGKRKRKDKKTLARQRAQDVCCCLAADLSDVLTIALQAREYQKGMRYRRAFFLFYFNFFFFFTQAPKLCRLGLGPFTHRSFQMATSTPRGPAVAG